MSFSERCKRVSEAWQALDTKERKKYEAQAAKDKERYAKEVAALSPDAAAALKLKPKPKRKRRKVRKCGLPMYVSERRSKSDRVCYEAKYTINGHKLVKLGSYADPQSASRAAQMFKISAIVDPATGNITLNDEVLKRSKKEMCSIYRDRTMNIDKVCVVVALRAILAKQLKRRNSKRKRDSETNGDSGAAAAASNEVATSPTAAAADALKSQPKRAKLARVQPNGAEDLGGVEE